MHFLGSSWLLRNVYGVLTRSLGRLFQKVIEGYEVIMRFLGSLQYTKLFFGYGDVKRSQGSHWTVYI